MISRRSILGIVGAAIVSPFVFVGRQTVKARDKIKKKTRYTGWHSTDWNDPRNWTNGVPNDGDVVYIAGNAVAPPGVKIDTLVLEKGSIEMPHANHVSDLNNLIIKGGDIGKA